MTYEDEDPDEHVTHDRGDIWAGNAKRGWQRCGDCGGEWAIEDEPTCKCLGDEEEE